jgi:hypothetical protein
MAGAQRDEKSEPRAQPVKTTTAGLKTGRKGVQGANRANDAVFDSSHVCGICNKCFGRSKSTSLQRVLELKKVIPRCGTSGPGLGIGRV